MVDSENRPIASLSIPRALKAALADKQYRTTRDLDGVSADDLAAELSVTAAQAETVLSSISTPLPSSSQIYSLPASSLLTQPATRYSTLSRALDDLVASFSPFSVPRGALNLKGKQRAWDGGAVGPGMVLEVSGPPGAGKSSLALALAMSARMGSGEGSEGEVLVVDTEGGITPSRLRDTADSLARHTTVSTPDILAGIHLVRIATQVQMVAFLNTLDDWLEAHAKVRLVVIDTLSFHFRQPSVEVGVRKRVMELVKQKIAKATTVHRCAVVVTNQLATKLLTADNKPATFETTERAVLMPQLGDAWTTEKTVRMLLFRGGTDELRYAHASSAAEDGAPWATFDIDDSGLPCDVPPVPERA
ncbi:hypothetical protein Q5752_003664 [Cryptotrichosporon argae]